MIFAQLDGNTLIIAAATTLPELETFYTKINAEPRDLYESFEQPAIADMLLDDRLFKFKIQPYVFEHSDPAQAKAFATKHEIQIVSQRALLEKNKQMMEAITTYDDYLDEERDNRPLSEIFDLKDNDFWDTRTPEQIAQQEHYKKVAEEAKKAGQLSDESFAPPSDKQFVGVTKVEVTKEQNGSITIDRAVAVKGLYDDDDKPESQIDETFKEPAPAGYRVIFNKVGEKDIQTYINLLGIKPISEGYDLHTKWILIKKEREANRIHIILTNHNFNFKIEVVDENGNQSDIFKPNHASAEEINPEGAIAIYFRVDYDGSLESLIDATTEIDGCSEMPDGKGCWIAVRTQRGAEEIQKIMTTAPGITEVYGVNDRGQRLVPKGAAQVVDVNDQEVVHPRIWNSRKNELASMTEEALKENRKTIKPKEFLFCGHYMGVHEGCVVYITPKSYFIEHDKMFEDASLDIGDLLPKDLKEVEPGVYRTKSQNWTSLGPLLGHLGFQESLMLQLHLNNL